MIDINLLPTQVKLSAVAQGWQKNLMVIAGAAGGLVLVAGGLMFGLKGLVAARIATLSTQKQEQQAQFNDNVPKLTMLVSLSDKLTGIKRVQAVRPNLSVAISAQQGLSSDGVATTKLNIGTGGSMDFDVTVRDTAALSTYLTRLESDQAKEFFTSLKISGLQLNSSGGFIFSVAAQFDKSKLIGAKSP